MTYRPQVAKESYECIVTHSCKLTFKSKKKCFCDSVESMDSADDSVMSQCQKVAPASLDHGFST